MSSYFRPNFRQPIQRFDAELAESIEAFRRMEIDIQMRYNRLLGYTNTEDFKDDIERESGTLLRFYWVLHNHYNYPADYVADVRACRPIDWDYVDNAVYDAFWHRCNPTQAGMCPECGQIFKQNRGAQ